MKRLASAYNKKRTTPRSRVNCIVLMLPGEAKGFFSKKKQTEMSKDAIFYSDKRHKDKSSTSEVIDLSDAFPLSYAFDQLDNGKYGSVTKEYENLHAERMQLMSLLSALRPLLSKLSPRPILGPRAERKEGNDNTSVIVLDSDEENANCEDNNCKGKELYDEGNAKMDGVITLGEPLEPRFQYQKVEQNLAEKQQIQDLSDWNYVVRKDEVFYCDVNKEIISNENSIDIYVNENCDVNSAPFSFNGTHEHSSGVEIHHEDDAETPKTDGLEDLWKDMSLAMESSKSPMLDMPEIVQREEECNHLCILTDDMGYVCRICGLIQRSMETIFDNQWGKATQRTRMYMSQSQKSKNTSDEVQYCGRLVSEDDLIAAEISIHPRHMKYMRPHQLEGFSFLVRNFITDKPGGCILAHAPGSGKTFMLISFIQSFLSKYPQKRPLVVLPKGIVSTWKKEFVRWQVEDIRLFDFYSAKADNRSLQLNVLKNWEENKSILFLSYKQFTNIVSGDATSNLEAACQERLLKIPGLLIIDEGHTPRNDGTLVADSLAKVQTHCKVVLSGTLYQNHVEEVFNILKLVRPRFMSSESSCAVIKRILSRLEISGKRRRLLTDGRVNSFFDLVEDTLQNDTDFKRKVAVIQDLRELTQNVLHYYKGDFLEELPGLVDFTVLLKLGAKQKEIVQELGRNFSFKRSSVGSAVYIHPHLREISENAAKEDKGTSFYNEKIDRLIDSLDVTDGVKTKFFLRILSLSESAGEKLLVFSQYLLPLKFLERLVVKMKGWRLGTEIFVISGDSGPEEREQSMEQFNSSPNAKVFFGSIKACGEGVSLIGASRVVILDVHLNPSVTRQAIGRAFRPGQEKKVYVYRLVAADSPEEEDRKTSFKKELIAKMWFEWSEYCGNQKFELGEVDDADCEDVFLESPNVREDIKALYRW